MRPEIPRSAPPIIRSPVSRPEMKPYWVAGGRLELPEYWPPHQTHTTLEYRRATSKHVGLYDGSAWKLREIDDDNPPTLSSSTLTPNVTYAVYLRQSGTGLELTTDESYAMTRNDGIWVLNSGALDRYLGLVRVNTAGEFEDSESQRFVANHYNRLWKPISYTFPPTVDLPSSRMTDPIRIVSLTGYLGSPTRWAFHLHFHLAVTNRYPEVMAWAKLQESRGTGNPRVLVEGTGAYGLSMSYSGVTRSAANPGYGQAAYWVWYGNFTGGPTGIYTGSFQGSVEL